MIFFTDMSVRLGSATPVSLITSIKEYLGNGCWAFLQASAFGITLMFSVGNAVSLSLGLSLILGGSPVLWTVVCTAAVGIVLAFKNVYGIVEKALIVIAQSLTVREHAGTERENASSKAVISGRGNTVATGCSYALSTAPVSVSQSKLPFARKVGSNLRPQPDAL